VDVGGSKFPVPLTEKFILTFQIFLF
jgi:hypothetical protein